LFSPVRYLILLVGFFLRFYVFESERKQAGGGAEGEREAGFLMSKGLHRGSRIMIQAAERQMIN